jgi:hypothetical protein
VEAQAFQGCRKVSGLRAEELEAIQWSRKRKRTGLWPTKRSRSAGEESASKRAYRVPWETLGGGKAQESIGCGVWINLRHCMNGLAGRAKP